MIRKMKTRVDYHLWIGVRKSPVCKKRADERIASKGIGPVNSI